MTCSLTISCHLLSETDAMDFTLCMNRISGPSECILSDEFHYKSFLRSPALEFTFKILLKSRISDIKHDKTVISKLLLSISLSLVFQPAPKQSSISEHDSWVRSLPVLAWRHSSVSAFHFGTFDPDKTQGRVDFCSAKNDPTIAGATDADSSCTFQQFGMTFVSVISPCYSLPWVTMLNRFARTLLLYNVCFCYFAFYNCKQWPITANEKEKEKRKYFTLKKPRNSPSLRSLEPRCLED